MVHCDGLSENFKRFCILKISNEYGKFNSTHIFLHLMRKQFHASVLSTLDFYCFRTWIILSSQDLLNERKSSMNAQMRSDALLTHSEKIPGRKSFFPCSFEPEVITEVIFLVTFFGCCFGLVLYPNLLLSGTIFHIP